MEAAWRLMTQARMLVFSAVSKLALCVNSEFDKHWKISKIPYCKPDRNNLNQKAHTAPRLSAFSP